LRLPYFFCSGILGFLMASLASFSQTGTFSEHDPRYRLEPSDVLEVHYRYTPEFDQTVAVEPDGFVSLQLVGDVKLQGLTLEQVKSTILDKASKRLRDPEINVVLKEFEKPYFVVGGEVTTPGRFEMRGTVTAVQAIAMAGGFKNSAKNSQVILFRKVSPDLARTQILNLKAVMNGSASEPNIDLRPGDTLIVPQNRISKIERLVKIANIGAYFPIPF
jgi:polysaccharide export outer membrane protein